MRTIVNQSYRAGVVTVVCDDGTFWIGRISRVDESETSDNDDLIVEWKPLNSPPDGDPFYDNRSDIDKLEDEIRANATEEVPAN